MPTAARRASASRSSPSARGRNPRLRQCWSLQVIEGRANLHVLINQKVQRVICSGDSIANKIPIVEIWFLSDSSGFFAKYRHLGTSEVIISAGLVHCPQILQCTVLRTNLMKFLRN